MPEEGRGKGLLRRTSVRDEAARRAPSRQVGRGRGRGFERFLWVNAWAAPDDGQTEGLWTQVLLAVAETERVVISNQDQRVVICY